ncbi:IS30 family transposase [Cryobacterium sp. 10I5]|uniref:IS30 family transposase n=1 Tax=Cryobacterium sp. 10I5 TaxID=3048581 RepID=UPI002B233105|nr:IS30 family transposase [Cryobacterium sp. 10I5]MEB0266898.1 IS30 family transposase [Cryobacterium sp. 10I5]
MKWDGNQSHRSSGWRFLRHVRRARRFESPLHWRDIEVDGLSVKNGYRAAHAERLAEARSRRPRLGKLASDDRLREHVESKLKVCWSPQQISKRLIAEFPDDSAMRVSHETIYTSLFVQAQPGLKVELTAKLRTRRLRRHPQRRVASGGKKSRIPGLVPLKDRPAEANDRKTPGHWEGDMIVGRYGTSHIVTLVERHSRILIAVPFPHGAKSETVIAALIETFNKLPAPMRRTLTWDRGTKMARHADFTIATGIPVFVIDGGEEQLLGGEGVVGFVLDEFLQSCRNMGHAKGPELVVIDAGEHHFPSSSRA